MKKRITFGSLSVILSLTAISAHAQIATPTPLTAISAADKAQMEREVKIVPTPIQLRWQHWELTAFTHFGINTFTNREWGTGKEDPKLFNPTALDCNQWVAALKAAGVRQIILTTKHHDGFCLWPTRYTNHSVKSSPWKNGQGDVVKEFVEACHKAGMPVGFYLSPADLYQIHSKGGYYGDHSAFVPSVIPTDPATFKTNPLKPRSPLAAGAPTFQFPLDDYNRYYMNELYELLTQYGPIDEVWFDSANPEPGTKETYAYQAWHDMVRKLQPNAVIHGTTTALADMRWVGNERGVGNETEWSVISSSMKAGREKTKMDANTLWWRPSEADVSIRPGWFYHANQQPKSLAKLLDIYFETVGRNSVLLLNNPPNRQGLLDQKDVQRLKEFGDALTTIFKTNLAAGARAVASNTRGNNPQFAVSQTIDPNAKGYWMADDWVMNPTITYTLAGAKTFNVILLQEEIAQSQRIAEFAVDAWENGAWKQIANGTTVGEKRLLRIPLTTTDKVRLRILKSRVCPTLKKFGLFFEPPSLTANGVK